MKTGKIRWYHYMGALPTPAPIFYTRTCRSLPIDQERVYIEIPTSIRTLTNGTTKLEYHLSYGFKKLPIDPVSTSGYFSSQTTFSFFFLESHWFYKTTTKLPSFLFNVKFIILVRSQYPLLALNIYTFYIHVYHLTAICERVQWKCFLSYLFY